MSKNTIKLFVIAGEASGDVLGGKLLKNIKDEIKDNPDFAGKQLKISGVGGPDLEKEGLKSIFDMSELSLMGFFEIIPHIPKLIRRINQTTQEIIKFQPDIVITIDAPDFCFRVIKKLQQYQISQRIKKIHFIAPTVWAYRAKRAKKIAKLFDLLLVILPFEPPYFKKYGLKTKFIGHPIVENYTLIKNSNFREKYKIDTTNKIICLTPGSRIGEIKRIFPEMIKAIQIIQKTHKNLTICLPIIARTKGIISKISQNYNFKSIIIDQEDKIELFNNTDLALAKSGTNTLEIALYKIPMIIAYKTNALTYFILRRLVKVKFANIINLILNRELIPEMLQDNCKAEKIAQKLEQLMTNKEKQEEQIKESQEILKTLGLNSKEQPSKKAAIEILYHFNL